MAVAKQNGDVIPFVKQKDYIMINNDLGGGSFGKTVLLQDPFIDELFVAKNMNQSMMELRSNSIRIFLMKSRFSTNSTIETLSVFITITLMKIFTRAISLWSTLTGKI